MPFVVRGPEADVSSLVVGSALVQASERAAAKPSMFVLDPGLSVFAGVLFGYVAAIAALATLSPFDFDWSHPHGYQFETSTGDIALNLGLLFPAGFLFRLARPGRGDRYGFDAFLLGLAFSAALELLQAFLPSRVTSPIDVITNALGALAGAHAHTQLGPWLDRRLQKQLSLHLPLANLLYLVVPLLSLEGLVVHQFSECVLLVPLTGFMALLAAGLYKHRLLANEAGFENRYALAIGGLFAVGYLPVCARSLPAWLALSLSTGLLTRLAIAFGTQLPKAERRFVPFTIRRALPWFVLYLLALALRPRLGGLLPGGFVELGLQGGEALALLLLRDVAAFTLLGYIVSELHARSTLPSAVIASRAAIGGSLCGVLFVSQRAAAVALAFQLLQLLVLVCAALAGAIIHRSQLRLVRSWGHSLPPTRASVCA